jgi:hypothetical protein
VAIRLSTMDTHVVIPAYADIRILRRSYIKQIETDVKANMCIKFRCSIEP